MTESFNQAWVLLGVGMVTVFTVLLLVVLIGNGLVLFVNRFLPESESGKPGNAGFKSAIHPSKVAAIVAGVKNVTAGRGNVVEIRKNKKI
ncbi:OadG family transporter subunit [Marinilabilia sp.]|uniref:OadG family transporter subunit n=1 Tax=Marinilabilia sp. TaxID=2021252 RepID=UPI0025C3982F|nr:OadG family transporter subunit [Marinilabilia sp.]